MTNKAWTVGGNEQIGFIVFDHFDNILAEHIKTRETARLFAASLALLQAADFARSVLAANPVEMSEQMAIGRLNEAIALAAETKATFAPRQRGAKK